MSATNEFQTARINGATDDGGDLYTKWQQLEAACRNIFGLTADSDYSEAMQIATGPDVTMTGTLTLAGAPTTDYMAATKAYVESLSSSAVGASRCRLYLTSNQEIKAETYIPWDACDIDSEGTMWDAGNPTRITIPDDGHYIVGFTASYVPLSGQDPAAKFTIYCNRSENHCVNQFLNEDFTDVEVGVSGIRLFCDLDEGDYLELRMYEFQWQELQAANTTFFAFRVY